MDELPGQCLVVSPHLDDAVFSCADWIAQSTYPLVVTVFAGVPANPGMLTAWDAAAGFSDAGQAMYARRVEDSAALAQLSARPMWLHFCDSQYEQAPTIAALVEALSGLVTEQAPTTVLFPSGLFHSDHMLVHQAMLAVRARFPAPRWIMYEDALYRRCPGLLQARLCFLAEAGIQATPAALPVVRRGNPVLKRSAVACYASQLRALTLIAEGVDDAFAPERYWRIDTSRHR